MEPKARKAERSDLPPDIPPEYLAEGKKIVQRYASVLKALEKY